MSILSWDDQYRIGDCAIDNAHKELFKLINELYSCWALQRSPNEIMGVLKKIKGHAEQAFALEEHTMERMGYPASARHRADHQRMVEIACDEIHRLGLDGVLSARGIQTFCRRWFMEHLVAEDFELRGFLRTCKESG